MDFNGEIYVELQLNARALRFLLGDFNSMFVSMKDMKEVVSSI